MTHQIRRAHPAMGTWFEVVLRGDDADHLVAVASAVFEEVDRVERLLSRFDPKSEVSRVNREAAGRPLRVGVELNGILLNCLFYWKATGGAFDVTATADQHSRSFADVELDPVRGTVRFARPGLSLDFGGLGKGYALDRAAEILKAQGVENALLHGATSSVLAVGTGDCGVGWPVGVRDPFRTPDAGAELFRVRLADRGFSCSAVFGHNQGVSDLIDPCRGRRLTEPAGCVVVAQTGVWAEVWSTALLAMGRATALVHADRLAKGVIQAVWIARDDGRPAWEWITEPAP